MLATVGVSLVSLGGVLSPGIVGVYHHGCSYTSAVLLVQPCWFLLFRFEVSSLWSLRAKSFDCSEFCYGAYSMSLYTSS